MGKTLNEIDNEQQQKWNTPVNGNIDVPDELVKLVNAVSMKIGHLLHLDEPQNKTVCDIVYIAQQSFKKKPALLYAGEPLPQAETATSIASKIFYSPATNGKAQKSINDGALLIEKYAAERNGAATRYVDELTDDECLAGAKILRVKDSLMDESKIAQFRELMQRIGNMQTNIPGADWFKLFTYFASIGVTIEK
jgi:hypothetical protein